MMGWPKGWASEARLSRIDSLDSMLSGGAHSNLENPVVIFKVETLTLKLHS